MPIDIVLIASSQALLLELSIHWMFKWKPICWAQNDKHLKKKPSNYLNRLWAEIGNMIQLHKAQWLTMVGQKQLSQYFRPSWGYLLSYCFSPFSSFSKCGGNQRETSTKKMMILSPLSPPPRTTKGQLLTKRKIGHLCSRMKTIRFLRWSNHQDPSIPNQWKCEETDDSYSNISFTLSSFFYISWFGDKLFNFLWTTNFL